jgi:hypothetical protein
VSIDLLLKKFLPPISCESNQPRTKKKHGDGLGNGRSIIYEPSQAGAGLEEMSRPLAGDPQEDHDKGQGYSENPSISINISSPFFSLIEISNHLFILKSHAIKTIQ